MAGGTKAAAKVYTTVFAGEKRRYVE